jgi:hypothetical protein
MIGLEGYAADGTLTIDGISMNRPAWGVFGDERGEGGLAKLWVEFDVRGEDRILPSVTGVIPYPRRMTVTRKDLRLVVVGDVNESGSPIADTRIGLQDNLEVLRNSVFEPVASSSGTRAAELLTPNGTVLEADIHVLGVQTQTYHLSECASIWVGTLQISIPGGRFS